MLPDLLCGDILLSANPGWPSKVVLFFGRLQTVKARMSHAAIGLFPTRVIESLWRVRIRPAQRYDVPGYRLALYRLPMTEAQRDMLATRLMEHAGDSYGWTKLPLFALDGMASWGGRAVGRRQPVFFFTRRFGLLNIPVCSQFAVYVLKKWASYPLVNPLGNHVEWRTVGPYYLDDLLKLPANRAQCIYETTGIAPASFVGQPIFQPPVSLV